MKSWLLLLALCAPLVAIAAQPAIGTPAPSVDKSKPTGKIREIEWIDLLPPDELDALMKEATIDHSKVFDPQSMDQGSFRVVAELNNQRLRMPGYIVPIDQTADGKLTEFFLVPFFGACIHVPPPPPNQIVYAKLTTPIEMTDIYTPFWAQGVLKTERIENDLAASAYTLIVEKVEAYE
jgi:uncharacterized protein